MKAHYGDIGIINIIRQRLKDVELQRWRWGVGGGERGHIKEVGVAHHTFERYQF